MNIVTKYNFGDVVRPISTRREEVRVPTNCPVCKDTGEVLIQDKHYTCPECNGRTYHIKDGDIEYYVTGREGIVGKIDIDLYDKTRYGGKSEIRYMLDSTGVGSGTCWEEKNLFASREEAQIECDIRNKGRYEPSSEHYIQKGGRD